MYSRLKSLGTHKLGVCAEWQWKHYHCKRGFSACLRSWWLGLRVHKLRVSMARCFFIQNKGQAHLEDIITASYRDYINYPAAKIYYKQAQRANLLIFPAVTGLFKGLSVFNYCSVKNKWYALCKLCVKLPLLHAMIPWVLKSSIPVLLICLDCT